MSTSTPTSIGPDQDRGSNEDQGNADGCGNKTLGEQATQKPPTGAGVVEDAAREEAGPDTPRGR